MMSSSAEVKQERDRNGRLYEEQSVKCLVETYRGTHFTAKNIQFFLKRIAFPGTLEKLNSKPRKGLAGSEDSNERLRATTLVIVEAKAKEEGHRPAQMHC